MCVTPPGHYVFYVVAKGPPLFVQDTTILTSLRATSTPFTYASYGEANKPISLASYASILSRRLSERIDVGAAINGQLVVNHGQCVSDVSPTGSSVTSNYVLGFFSAYLSILICVCVRTCASLRRSPPHWKIAVGDTIFCKGRSLEIRRSTGPTINEHSILVGIGTYNIYNASIRVCRNSGNTTSIAPPAVLNRRFTNIIRTINDSITNFGPNSHIYVSPGRPYNYYRPYHSKVGRCYRRVANCNAAIGNNFTRCYSISVRRICGLNSRADFRRNTVARPITYYLRNVSVYGVGPNDAIIIVNNNVVNLLVVRLTGGTNTAGIILLRPIRNGHRITLGLNTSLTVSSVRRSIPTHLGRRNINGISIMVRYINGPIAVRRTVRVTNRGTAIVVFNLAGPSRAVAIGPFRIFRGRLILASSCVGPCARHHTLRLVSSNELSMSSVITGMTSLSRLNTVLSSPTLHTVNGCVVSPDGWVS